MLPTSPPTTQQAHATHHNSTAKSQTTATSAKKQKRNTKPDLQEKKNPNQIRNHTPVAGKLQKVNSLQQPPPSTTENTALPFQLH
jgi:hypothetical protein